MGPTKLMPLFKNKTKLPHTYNGDVTKKLKCYLKFFIKALM